MTQEQHHQQARPRGERQHRQRDGARLAHLVAREHRGRRVARKLGLAQRAPVEVARELHAAFLASFHRPSSSLASVSLCAGASLSPALHRGLDLGFKTVFRHLFFCLVDVDAPLDALAGEEPADVLDDVRVRVHRGDADAQIVAERAHQEVQAGGRGQDVDVADIGGQAFVDADGAEVRHGGGHVARGQAVRQP